MAETLGSLVDKITIIELKIYHMREQAERTDRGPDFRAQCDSKLEVMREQRDDLAAELTALVGDIAAGRVVPKVYRQFKMYNDPQYRSGGAVGANPRGDACVAPAPVAAVPAVTAVPLTVVHVDPERGWRGGQRQTLWLAAELARRGHRSIVAARPGEPLHERARAAGLEVVGAAPFGELDLLAALRLRRVIRRERADIVHAHSGHSVALAALATLGTRARVVVTRRVDFRLRNNPGTRWKYGRAACVVAISRAVADVLRASGLRRPAAVIPDGIDLGRRVTPAAPETLESLGVPRGAPLVVMVAALVGHKDPLNFVAAVDAARRRVPALHALLVGDGYLRPQVESAVAERGLAGVLHVAGYRTDADELLAAASVATLSSREEGMGSVLLDALAFGVPVAATRAGGIPDVIVDGASGLLVPPRDGDALGGAIARILLDPALAARLAAAGRARVRRFSLERMARRYEVIYRRVLAR